MNRTPARRYACPRCGSPDHLAARQSITYDAYQDVRVEVTRDGEPRVVPEGKAELNDVEQVVTVWYICASEDCESELGASDLQLEDLALWPADFDLCAKCDHLYESHHWTEGDRVCQECGGCEDFVVRVVPDAQPELHPGLEAIAA